MKKIIIPLLCSLYFFGCSKDSGSSSNKTESYTYSLTENGCETKTHTFRYKTDLCRALQDDALNNNCAATLREQRFNSECPGQAFKPKPPAPQPSPSPTTSPPSPNPAPYPANSKPLPEHADIMLSLFRTNTYDGSICDSTVFSGKFKELFPQLPISGISGGSIEPNFFDDYGTMRINIVSHGFAVSTFTVSGKKEALNSIKEKLQRREDEIRLTESKICAEKNPSLTLVDLVSATQFDQRRINIKCELLRTFTLADLIRRKNPSADLNKGTVRYDLFTSGRTTGTGEIGIVRLSLSYKESLSSANIWEIEFSPQLIHTVLDLLSQNIADSKMTVSSSPECRGERKDNPVMLITK
jgi:hypothetical protein